MRRRALRQRSGPDRERTNGESKYQALHSGVYLSLNDNVATGSPANGAGRPASGMNHLNVVVDRRRRVGNLTDVVDTHAHTSGRCGGDEDGCADTRLLIGLEHGARRAIPGADHEPKHLRRVRIANRGSRKHRTICLEVLDLLALFVDNGNSPD